MALLERHCCKEKGKPYHYNSSRASKCQGNGFFLEEQGFRITFLSVDSRGQISLEDLKEALTPDTILVSIMYVNNEIGTIQPVEEAAKWFMRLFRRCISCGCHSGIWQGDDSSKAAGN